MKMTPTRTALALVMVSGLGACTAATSGIETAAQAVSDTASQAVAAAALDELLVRSEAAYLDRNPVSAFFRSDFSDADRLGDFSPAYYVKERASAQADLAALRLINRTALSETDRIVYDTFEYTMERRIAETAPDVLPTVLFDRAQHQAGGQQHALVIQSACFEYDRTVRRLLLIGQNLFELCLLRDRHCMAKTTLQEGLATGIN